MFSLSLQNMLGMNKPTAKLRLAKCCTQEQEAEFQSQLNALITKADIEVHIKNFDIPNINGCYLHASQEISPTKIKLNQSDTLKRRIKRQEIEYLIKFPARLNGGLSQQDALVFLAQQVIGPYLETFKKQEIKFQVDEPTHHYKCCRMVKTEDQVQEFDTLCQKLDQDFQQTKLVHVDCQSAKEASIIREQLLQEATKQTLGECLGIEVRHATIIGSTKVAQLEGMQAQLESITALSKLCKSVAVIYSNKNDENYEFVEQELQNFMQLECVSETVNEDQLIVSSNINIEKVRASVKSRIQLRQQMDIEIIEMAQVENFKRVKIIYRMIHPKTMQQSDIDEQVVTNKLFVKSSLKPLYFIRFTSHEQKSLWRSFLLNRVMREFKQVEFQIISGLDSSDLLILVSQNQQITTVPYEQLEKMFKQYQFLTLDCECSQVWQPGVENVDQIFDFIFVAELKQFLQTNQSVMLLKVTQISPDQKIAKVEVVVESSQLNRAMLKSQIETKLLSQLRVSKIQINFHKFLAGIKMSQDDFEENFSVKIIPQDSQWINVICSEQKLSTVVGFLEDGKIHQEQVVKSIWVGQKSIINKLKQLKSNNQLNFAQDIKVEIQKDQVVLSGCRDEIAQAENSIEESLTMLRKNLIKKEVQLEGWKIKHINKKPQILNEIRSLGCEIYFEYSQSSLLQSQSCAAKLIVECFDNNTYFEIVHRLQKNVEQHVISITISIPCIEDTDMIQLSSILLKKSIRMEGELQQGLTTQIHIFEYKKDSILNAIEKFLQTIPQYPTDWVLPDENFSKLEIHIQSKEFKHIKMEFEKTEMAGAIRTIYRLQNKAQYRNYLTEKRKLIELGKHQVQPYSDLELERFLWHGVKNHHPRVIYEGVKEAFDPTFSSNDANWGPGIYFAQNASYSRFYSYKMEQRQPNEGPLNVLLLCKVCTGKVYNCESNSNLRRPPPGYDCVSGVSGDSQIYVLYGVDVRRAYPAYEIIFV